MSNIDCPLCSEPAETRLFDFGNQIEVTCPSCTVFRITKGTAKHLNEKFADRKSRFIELINATPPGKTVLIRYQLLPSEKGGELDVYAEMVPNEDLPSR